MMEKILEIVTAVQFDVAFENIKGQRTNVVKIR